MSEKGAVTDSAGAVRRDRLLLALTFAAGSVDALSYVGLSRVFTANMTGNAVLLGLATIGAIVVGAVIGGVAQAYACPEAAFVPAAVPAVVVVAAVSGFRRAT